MSIHGSIRHTALVAALAAVSLTGCAAAGTGGPSAPSVSIEVANDLQPPTAVTIFAERTEGAASRRSVGNVSPGGTRTLTLSSTSGQYVLIARTTAGREIVSNPFVISPGTSVRWSLSSNLISTQ